MAVKADMGRWPQGKTWAGMISVNLDGEFFSRIYYPEIDVDSVPEFALMGGHGIKNGLPRMLDLLEAHKLRATFFIPGQIAVRYPQVVREIASRGHEIGCHGNWHENLGTFFFCREVIPLMKAQRSGKIISMSSGGGVIGMEHLCHYATAKAALFGFIKSIARELGPYNVHANCIAVPTTVTPGSSDYDYDDDAEAEIPEIPLGRLAYPPDIANMTLYLSSSASDYVTGQVLAPNGGKR